MEDSSSVPGEDDLINTIDQTEEDFNSLPDDWSICSPPSQVRSSRIFFYIKENGGCFFCRRARLA